MMHLKYYNIKQLNMPPVVHLPTFEEKNVYIYKPFALCSGHRMRHTHEATSSLFRLAREREENLKQQQVQPSAGILTYFSLSALLLFHRKKNN